MTVRIITDSNGRKHITNEPLLHQPAPVQSCYCPNCEAMGKELAALKAQPAPVQPVAVTYKEVADTMNALWGGTLKQVQIAMELANKKLYAAPPAAQRQWAGLTDEEMYLNCPNWLSQEQCKVWVAQIETKLKGKNTAAQPAVPDAIHHTDLSEHPQYIEGWNDCRAEMLKGMKP